jgi:signal transduction histidine kinase
VSAWSRLSIATKLPLSAAALLCLVLGGITVAAWAEVRRTALDSASNRLGILTALLQRQLTAGATQRFADLQTLAADSGLVRLVTTGDTSGLDASRGRLAGILPRSSITRAFEVWDSSGARALHVGRATTPLEADETRALMDGAAARGGSYVGPFGTAGDTLTYTVVTPMLPPDGMPYGYLVERLIVQGAGESARFVSSLIGANAAIRVGTPGGTWTDLERLVPGPAAALPADTSLFDFEEGGERLLGRAASIDGTSWRLLVSFPAREVLASANGFLRQSIIASLLLVLVGAGIAWVASRRMTTPLRQVTEAAEAIAAGEPAPRLTTGRRDEVGRLETSFNSMAEQVEEGRRRLEQRVQERTAALEHANRELEAFSYSVSHDLRAPLRAIDGFARILVEDHGDELSEQAQQRVMTITRNARQMGHLIDDLLAFSRLSRQPMRSRQVDMNELAAGAVDAVRRAEPARTIVFDVQDLPPAAGEPALLQQVLANLVDNAAKFTRPRHDARIEIGHVAMNGVVTYYVRDNGVGFDMRYADKLFGVFQRLHRPDEFEGTGVGLALVHRIIHRHGGEIRAESAPDQGATFYFTVPGELTDG